MQSVNALFLAYANYGTRATTSDLDGAKFVKLFKDCGLVRNGLTTTDLDIIYSKVLLLECTEYLRLLRASDWPT